MVKQKLLSRHPAASLLGIPFPFIRTERSRKAQRGWKRRGRRGGRDGGGGEQQPEEEGIIKKEEGRTDGKN